MIAKECYVAFDDNGHKERGEKKRKPARPEM